MSVFDNTCLAQLHPVMENLSWFDISTSRHHSQEMTKHEWSWFGWLYLFILHL